MEDVRLSAEDVAALKPNGVIAADGLSTVAKQGGNAPARALALAVNRELDRLVPDPETNEERPARDVLAGQLVNLAVMGRTKLVGGGEIKLSPKEQASYLKWIVEHLDGPARVGGGGAFAGVTVQVTYGNGETVSVQAGAAGVEGGVAAPIVEVVPQFIDGEVVVPDVED